MQASKFLRNFGTEGSFGIHYIVMYTQTYFVGSGGADITEDILLIIIQFNRYIFI